MKLNEKLAQEIVNRMMKDIPYNINIMNEKGYIIASGKKERIGQLHIGAQQILKSQKIETKTMAQKCGDQGLPGVNMPISVDNHLVGVVGITGDPEKVKPLAALVKTTTELLLEREELSQVRAEYKRRFQKFLFEWSRVTEGIEDNLGLQTDAEHLHINIMIPRQAALIKCRYQEAKKYSLIPKDYLLNYSQDCQIFLISRKDNMQKLISWAKDNSYSLAIGNFEVNIGNSIKQAQRVTLYQRIFPNTRYCFYNDVSFLMQLLEIKIPEESLKKIEKVSEQEDLLKTVVCYVENNGAINQTAIQLHVHRNTLKYRMKRIKDMTGLNPENWNDLFKLYVAIMHYQFNKLKDKK